MRTLILAPDQATYDVTDATQVVSVQLDGGMSRTRADIENGTSIVTAEWSIDPAQYQYLRAFYRTASQNASEPFNIDLILDQPGLTTHVATFVAGSMKLASQAGLTYVVTASLEVQPVVQNDDLNNSIMDMFESYGEYSYIVLNELEKFVNFELPVEWAEQPYFLTTDTGAFVVTETGNNIVIGR